MKKAFTILILFLTLASAIRLTIDRHFCGGRVVDIILETGSKRASCGMKSCEAESADLALMLAPAGCCHNELVTYSVDNYLVTDGLEIERPFTQHNKILFGVPVFRFINNKKFVLTMPGTAPPGSCIVKPGRQSRLGVFQI